MAMSRFVEASVSLLGASASMGSSMNLLSSLERGLRLSVLLGAPEFVDSTFSASVATCSSVSLVLLTSRTEIEIIGKLFSSNNNNNKDLYLDTLFTSSASHY